MTCRATRLRAALLAVAATAAATAAVAGAVHAVEAARPSVVTERARLGAWTASLRLELTGDPEYRRIRSARLRVTRGGTAVLDRRVTLPRACADGGCVLLDGGRVLELRRLDGPDPLALLWLWTGGAHCCSVLQAIELPAARSAVVDLGNGGGSFDRLDGETVLVGQDERFPYRYTSYAASGSPVRVFALAGGRFRDVTAAHQAAVQADARAWWDAYLDARSGGWEARGVFAAWAADACRLGRRAKVEARLAEGIARGWFSLPRAEALGPHGARFGQALLADLVQLGYCRPR